MITKNLIGSVLVAILFVLPNITRADFSANLQYGSSGSSVSELQEFLTDQNLYSGPVTGNFFSLTLRAVKNFQAREEIQPVSGYFGPKTRTRVNAILAQNLKQSDEESQAVVPTVVPPSLTQKTTTISLPNGAVVEIDQTGQIVRYTQPTSVPTPSISTPSVPATPQPQNITQPAFQVVTTKNNQSTKPGSSRYELFVFQVSTDKDIETSNLYFSLSLFGVGGKASDISNVMLVDSNGVVLAGPMNAIGDSQGNISFTDTVTFRKGVSVYSLKGTLANAFSPNQVINVTAEKEKWSAQESKTKTVAVPAFSASDMLVTIASRSNQQNAGGSFTSTLALQSTTDLSELVVRMTRQDNQANVLTKTASRRYGTNLYDVEFSQLQTGLYDMEFIADASKLPIGVVKIFKETYLVQ